MAKGHLNDFGWKSKLNRPNCMPVDEPAATVALIGSLGAPTSVVAVPKTLHTHVDLTVERAET